MSYQVLARKWRPHSFSTLIGQDHVVRALTHALTENRLHHAYLFTGTRGVGKTTISRILAKCLNCTGEDGHGGITAEPCGKCEACTAIDQDRFVDYIEMDAASTRGIDDMVTLLERAKYAPTNARFKVYMIDEVHQLTTQAFNAMLKTLEEPPEYVKFILATTDPQKVPITVLSRCLQFNLKSLSPAAITSHMETLLTKEGIKFEVPALRMLASGARGSMRDGLSLLDQAIAFSAGDLTVESVREMLGTIDSTTLVRLLGALANREPAQIMQIADEIGSRSLSYPQALKDLALLLHRIAMTQLLPQSLAPEEPDAAAIAELAKAFTPDEVQLYYQIAIHARNEMNMAPDEYSGFTMALLRMMAFAPFNGEAPRKVVVPVMQTESVALQTQQSAEPAVKPTQSVQVVQPMAEPTSQPTKPVEQPVVKPVAEPIQVQTPSKPAEPEVIAPWEDEAAESVAESKKKDELSADTALNSNPAPIQQTQAPTVQPVAQHQDLTLPEDDVPYEYDGAEYDGYGDDGYGSGYDDYGSSAHDPDPTPTGLAYPTQSGEKNARSADPFAGVRVEENPWLKAARQIHLKDSSQPLVEQAELIEYADHRMVLGINLEVLTQSIHTNPLADELRKVLDPQLTLDVHYVPGSGKGQTLSRLRKQDFLDEKYQKLDKISRNKKVREFAEEFNAPLLVENVTLLDAQGF